MNIKEDNFPQLKKEKIGNKEYLIDTDTNTVHSSIEDYVEYVFTYLTRNSI